MITYLKMPRNVLGERKEFQKLCTSHQLQETLVSSLATLCSALSIPKNAQNLSPKYIGSLGGWQLCCMFFALVLVTGVWN